MPEAVDIILRSVAVTSALLLAALLAAAGPRRAGPPGAVFCLAVAAFVVTSLPNAQAFLGIGYWPLTALCVAKAALFWLFARALFTDNARLGLREAVILGVVAIAGTWQQTVFLERYRTGTAATWETVAGFGIDAVLLLFVVLALHAAWRGLAVDLVERRRRLRLGFIATTGAYLAVALGVQAYNLVLDVTTPAMLARANLVLIAAVSVAAASKLIQIRTDSWLDPGPTRAASLNGLEAAVLRDLRYAMESDRVFLEEGLTIGGLAEKLGTREHVLRRVINRGLGHRNFNDFLHAWRIREACAELARPEQAKLPVLSIAMKVGYGSVGAFNRAFKARTGMTPTDFRRRSSDGASHVH